ncbi:MAG: DUF6247 family protein [Pseudonocardiaceae bacterium]
MTALWSFDEQPCTGDPLLPGAAPAAIRDVLLPEDRVVFDAVYQRALAAGPGGSGPRRAVPVPGALATGRAAPT